MTPSLPDLLAPATSLAGVGEKTAGKLTRLLGPDPTVLDLLFHLPTGAIERHVRTRISDLRDGEHATIALHVLEHRPPEHGSAAPYAVVASDGAEHVQLLHWARPHHGFVELLPKGARRRVSGKVKLHNGVARMYPDMIEPAEGESRIPLVSPVYAAGKALPQSTLSRMIVAALRECPDVPEWLPAALLKKHGWPSFRDALVRLHRPQAVSDAALNSPARSRLAFDELFARQLELAVRRARSKQRAKAPVIGNGGLRESILFDFPHRLTPSQERAVAEVESDLAKPHVTTRLLQGDVGSGKTMVALLAAAIVAEAGRQAALMAPTEILARQHFATIAPLAEGAGMQAALLTGSTPASERADTLKRLADGDIDLIVGTHALIEPNVRFHDLALAIVDEQHRFGVDERTALVRKGKAVDGLLLSATPIPRTLALALHGDMAVSELREKPAGRKPVDTRCVPVAKIGDVVDAARRAIEKGGRIFWVCPLVSESDRSDLASATERAEYLRERLAGVELIHGRMKATDKDAAMARFASGASRILVATTVIEVGVDVPEANIIVIEHAERFGLSQLHQLRGRVGRGSAQSFCILLHDTDADDEAARARLGVLRDTDDGFVIAERDLQLRGAGDLLGRRQHGDLGLRVADMEAHGPLLRLASESAREAIDSGRNRPALSTLLVAFNRAPSASLASALKPSTIPECQAPGKSQGGHDPNRVGLELATGTAL